MLERVNGAACVTLVVVRMARVEEGRVGRLAGRVSVRVEAALWWRRDKRGRRRRTSEIIVGGNTGCCYVLVIATEATFIAEL